MKSRRIDNRSASKIKSFLKGFSSAFDLSGLTLLRSTGLANGSVRDANALDSDWKKIGRDIRKSMDTVANGN